MFLLWLAFAALGPGCGNQDVLILSLRTQPGTQVRSYIVQVQERTSRRVIYHSGTKLLDNAKDLSADPLRIGLKFDQAGSYLVHILAAGSEHVELLPTPGGTEPELFWAGLLSARDMQQLDALLLPVPPQFDQDRDHFPDAEGWLASNPDAAALYQGHSELLDCVDQEPLSGDLLPIDLHAYDIHPLATPRCNVRFRPHGPPGGELPPLQIIDVTCAGVPQTCLDADGDGESSETDCDDHDPRRFHGNPKPRNCCVCNDRESCAKNHAHIPDLSFCNPARCDSSFDYGCTGTQVDCFVDDDCDGFSPNDPNPSQRDCDDHDARVHPGANKLDFCSSPEEKDWACDGNPNAGCIDCDLDGDGYQRLDPPGSPGAHCPDPVKNKHPGLIDCDDNDRGVFPGASTIALSSLLQNDLSREHQGGTVAGALRGLCRNRSVSVDPARSDQPQNTDCVADPKNIRNGCPPNKCDLDGDGFPNADTEECNPGHRYPIDLDDNEYRSFPGAPEYCLGPPKDWNQDGQQDTCIVDADGDGYDSRYDCDDANPNVHPFAPELCNGIDDDCDGLVDEENPSYELDPKKKIDGVNPLGNRLVEKDGDNIVVTSCTDSNVGDCKKTTATGAFTGRCVCTRVDPTTPHLDNATHCPGFGKATSMTLPKCFSAYQPQQQTCVADSPRDEDCDGRTDAPDGKNLKEYGAKCGIAVGQCKASTVVGCDRGKVNPFAAKDSYAPTFDRQQKYYVCDEKSVFYPKDELCNGLDDDCDSHLPGYDAALPLANPQPAGDEIDHDGDKYMACTGCDGLTMAPGLRGCNDCNDGDKTIYPTAPELCDGKDNACKGTGNYTDGVDQCGAAITCCPNVAKTKYQCINLQTDFLNCNGCNVSCKTRTADSCVAGVCQCKNEAACSGSKPVCKAGQGCVECLQNGDCTADLFPGKAYCNPVNKCVECLDDTACSGKTGKTHCDADAATANAYTCVECTGNDQCPVLRPNRADSCNNNNVCICTNDPACDPKSDAKAFCLKGKKCVQCLDDTPCAGKTGTTHCGPANTCAECTADKQCTDTKPGLVDICNNSNVCACHDMAPCSGATPHCKVGVGCKECLSDGDCKDKTKPHCTDAGTCSQCATDAQCLVDFAGTADSCSNMSTCMCKADNICSGAKPHCRTAVGCIECLTDLECSAKGNSKNHCTDGGACSQCNSDAQCKADFAGKADRCDNMTSCLCKADAICSGATPYCKADVGCKECLNDDQCKAKDASKPYCNDSGVCAQCKNDDECKADFKNKADRCDNMTSCLCKADAICSGATPYCKADVGCKECGDDTYCKDKAKPHCTDANSCSECKTDDQCKADFPGKVDRCDNMTSCKCHDDAKCSGDKPVCNAGAGCVQCLMDGDCAGGKKCDNDTHKCV